jgi:hypothetical protein
VVAASMPSNAHPATARSSRAKRTQLAGTLANRRMPAPPHDASGHTWHDSDRKLYLIMKKGLAGDGQHRITFLDTQPLDSAAPSSSAMKPDERLSACRRAQRKTWLPRCDFDRIAVGTCNHDGPAFELPNRSFAHALWPESSHALDQSRSDRCLGRQCRRPPARCECRLERAGGWARSSPQQASVRTASRRGAAVRRHPDGSSATADTTRAPSQHPFSKPFSKGPPSWNRGHRMTGTTGKDLATQGPDPGSDRVGPTSKSNPGHREGC